MNHIKSFRGEQRVQRRTDRAHVSERVTFGIDAVYGMETNACLRIILWSNRPIRRTLRKRGAENMHRMPPLRHAERDILDMPLKPPRAMKRQGAVDQQDFERSRGVEMIAGHGA